MKLIIGLGNPSKTYEKTRHNAGYAVLDALAAELHLPAWTNAPQDIQAKVTDMLVEGEKIIFAKPETFMNNSGFAVAALMKYFTISGDKLLVAHDDLDIPLGEIKAQHSRGAAGHNGVDSIIQQLGNKNFSRVRVGIGPGRKPADSAKFVLGRFGLFEKSRIKKGVSTAVTAVQEWMR
ncbi:MAG: aminoacyl-tRNA hydrolase [Patescibacteria group bacterium]